MQLKIALQQTSFNDESVVGEFKSQFMVFPCLQLQSGLPCQKLFPAGLQLLVKPF
jgi:hypothetical protein